MPTVVSDGRQDTDKGRFVVVIFVMSLILSWWMLFGLAGKVSLVFDAVFHSSLKSRTLRDPEFKTFLIGTAAL